jgi:hypothetical protein
MMSATMTAPMEVASGSQRGVVSRRSMRTE